MANAEPIGPLGPLTRESLGLTTLTLTDRELAVISRSLEFTASFVNALGDDAPELERVRDLVATAGGASA